MKEVWKELKEDSNYLVSNFGNVRVKDRVGKTGRKLKAKQLKPNILASGYIMANIGLRKIYIHRLVCYYFNKNPQNKPCVNHIDGDKSNNRFDNLEWCTYSENMIHAENNELTNHKAKLTNNDVLSIRADKRLHKDIAVQYNVSRSLITQIKLGKRRVKV